MIIDGWLATGRETWLHLAVENTPLLYRWGGDGCCRLLRKMLELLPVLDAPLGRLMVAGTTPVRVLWRASSAASLRFSARFALARSLAAGLLVFRGRLLVGWTRKPLLLHGWTAEAPPVLHRKQHTKNQTTNGSTDQ